MDEVHPAATYAHAVGRVMSETDPTIATRTETEGKTDIQTDV